MIESLDREDFGEDLLLLLVSSQAIELFEILLLYLLAKLLSILLEVKLNLELVDFVLQEL